MAKFVALLRGINVGRAKTVSMVQLTKVFESLGFGDVRTVLRSGNVVFSADDTARVDAGAIEVAVLAATGVQSSVLVIDAASFVAIAGANPLLEVATDGSKLLVTFLGSRPSHLQEPEAAALHPEILRVGDRAIYQWLPDGSMQTKVPRSFWKQFGGALTARNWNTVSKLVELLE